MTCRGLVLICLGVFTPLGRAPAEVLVYERFENSTQGTVRGGVDFSTEVVGYGGTAVPNRHAAVFDGAAASCVDYGKTTKVTSTDFTVEAFVRLESGPSYHAIAADWSEDGENRSWALVLTPNGALRFDVSPDGAFHAGNTLVTRPRMIRRNTWYHVAAVSRAATSRIYLNGRQIAEKTRPHGGLFSGDGANLKIGNVDSYASNGPRPWKGPLDEVRITEKALQAADFVRTKQPMPEVAGPTPAQFEMPFVATSESEALAWQQRARARLLQLVEQRQPRCPTSEVPIDLRLGEGEDRGEYTLYHGSFQGSNTTGERFAVRLCVPKGQGPFPAMLCLHGHGGTAEKLFDPRQVYHELADHFARSGYVVLAPSFPHRKYAAKTLWDLMRCVDILASRPQVDAKRIGVGGLSMGGEWTMWAAACDPRLKVAVVSGWMCTTEGVFSVPNCECWELPGFVELMDVCEVNLLIAPRPVLFESAQRDGCFPVEYTKKGFARIRHGYKVFGAEGAAVHDVFPGVHEWHGTVAYPLVDKVLGGRAAEAAR